MIVKMKTTFNMEKINTRCDATISIIGEKPKDKPYVQVQFINNKDSSGKLYLKNKGLEKFAINILKSLNSNKLKNEKQNYKNRK